MFGPPANPPAMFKLRSRSAVEVGVVAGAAERRARGESDHVLWVKTLTMIPTRRTTERCDDPADRLTEARPSGQDQADTMMCDSGERLGPRARSESSTPKKKKRAVGHGTSPWAET